MHASWTRGLKYIIHGGQGRGIKRGSVGFLFYIIMIRPQRHLCQRINLKGCLYFIGKSNLKFSLSK